MFSYRSSDRLQNSKANSGRWCRRLGTDSGNPNKRLPGTMEWVFALPLSVAGAIHRFAVVVIYDSPLEMLPSNYRRGDRIGIGDRRPSRTEVPFLPLLLWIILIAF